MSSADEARKQQPDGSKPDLVLGLVAGPGNYRTLAEEILGELESDLSTRLPGVRWRITLAEDRLVQPPADDAEIMTAARDLLLNRDWDLVVCLTDLPLQTARRPVVASSVHSVALLSVPALGAVDLHRRVRQAVINLVDSLLGEPDETDDRPATARDRDARLSRRAKELASPVGDADALVFTARVLTGNLRLLAGMIRANEPWRLAADLSRALTAAIAAGVFALITPDIWRLADAYGALRLITVAVASVAAVVVTLILGAGLWERAPKARMRQQVVLFNLATVGTLLIGVLAFYSALFIVAAIASPLFVVPRLLAQQVGHPVGVAEYLDLAWLTASLAMAGGALGAGLETDSAVRAAAYTNRSPETEDLTS